MSDDTVYIIDAIKNFERVLDLLRPALMDETKISIICNGSEDMSLLKEDFEIFPYGVIDVCKCMKNLFGLKDLPNFDQVMSYLLGNFCILSFIFCSTEDTIVATISLS